MLRVLKKTFRLSGGDFFLYLKVLILAGFVRICILVLPFKWIARYLGSQGAESPYVEEAVKLAASRKIGRVIEGVSRHTLWESKCLVQGITGKLLLRKIKIANTLYFGVRKDEKNKLIAHAWLRVGPIVITGQGMVEEFKIVACFGDINNYKK